MEGDVFEFLKDKKQKYLRDHGMHPELQTQESFAISNKYSYMHLCTFCYITKCPRSLTY